MRTAILVIPCLLFLGVWSGRGGVAEAKQAVSHYYGRAPVRAGSVFGGKTPAFDGYLGPGEAPSPRGLLLALAGACLPGQGLSSSGRKGAETRLRCRDLGIAPGILAPGRWNAITDVAGVKVGSVTLWEGDSVRTGVTVILPHGGNVFQEKVPAAVYVGNGFGKAVGFLQVEELGRLESPIALTNTLNVWLVADALLDYVLGLPGNEGVRSVNVVVGETNDGYLNAIRTRSVRREHVFEAISRARGGPVEEGAVGAGTGTVCFGFKGGIGTSSRVLPESKGGYTVGALVQTNFGGILTIDGVPVGEELGRYYMKDDVTGNAGGGLGSGSVPRGIRGGAEISHSNRSGSGEGAVRFGGDGDGSAEGGRGFGGAPAGSSGNEDVGGDLDAAGSSCMIVLATDAPLSARNLKRLTKRAMLGLARAGGFSSNGSGDFIIAFSTAHRSAHRSEQRVEARELLRDDGMSPLFLAAVEAVEEAILNSLFKATTVCGYRSRCVEALPLKMVKEVMRKYGR